MARFSSERISVAVGRVVILDKLDLTDSISTIGRTVKCGSMALQRLNIRRRVSGVAWTSFITPDPKPFDIYIKGPALEGSLLPYNIEHVAL